MTNSGPFLAFRPSKDHFEQTSPITATAWIPVERKRTAGIVPFLKKSVRISTNGGDPDSPQKITKYKKI
jgi:hypothetical protein